MTPNTSNFVSLMLLLTGCLALARITLLEYFAFCDMKRMLERKKRVAKQPVTVEEFIKYRLDVLISSNSAAKPLILLALTFIIITASCVVRVSLQEESLADALWTSWTHVADPGTHAGAERGLERVMGLATTVSGLLVFALTLGVVSAAIGDSVDALNKGSARVVECGHTLMLGWSEKGLAVVQQLALANASAGGRAVVVLSAEPKAAMEELVRRAAARRRGEGHLDLRGSRVVFRCGNPMSELDLAQVSAGQARAVIILSQPGIPPDEADSRIVRQILSLRQTKASLLAPPPARPASASLAAEAREAEAMAAAAGDDGAWGHIVAELQDVDNLAMTRMVGGDDVEVIVSHELIGRLMLLAARSQWIAPVLSALMGFEGSEFYFKEWPALVGRRYGSICLGCFPDAVVVDLRRAAAAANCVGNAAGAAASASVAGGRRESGAGTAGGLGGVWFGEGVGGGVILNPPDDLVIAEGDELLVLAEDDDSYTLVHDSLPRMMSTGGRHSGGGEGEAEGSTNSIAEVSMADEDGEEVKAAAARAQLAASRRVVRPEPGPEKILFCGWRRDMADMIAEADLDSRPGSELWLFSGVEVRDRAERLRDKGNKAPLRLKNLRLRHVVGNPASRRELVSLQEVSDGTWEEGGSGGDVPMGMPTGRRVVLSYFTSILILSDCAREDGSSGGERDVEASDCRSLATALGIQDVQQAALLRLRSLGQQVERRPPTVEILDIRTARQMALISEGYVMSNHLVASYLAMVAEDRHVNRIYAELLSCRGNEIQVVRLADYARVGEDELLSFEELQRIGRALGDTVLGYIPNRRLATYSAGAAADPHARTTRSLSIDAVAAAAAAAAMAAGGAAVGLRDSIQLNPEQKAAPRRWHAEDRVVLVGASHRARVKEQLARRRGASEEALLRAFQETGRWNCEDGGFQQVTIYGRIKKLGRGHQRAIDMDDERSWRERLAFVAGGGLYYVSERRLGQRELVCRLDDIFQVDMGNGWPPGHFTFRLYIADPATLRPTSLSLEDVSAAIGSASAAAATSAAPSALRSPASPFRRMGSILATDSRVFSTSTLEECQAWVEVLSRGAGASGFVSNIGGGGEGGKGGQGGSAGPSESTRQSQGIFASGSGRVLGAQQAEATVSKCPPQGAATRSPESPERFETQNFRMRPQLLEPQTGEPGPSRGESSLEESVQLQLPSKARHLGTMASPSPAPAKERDNEGDVGCDSAFDTDIEGHGITPNSATLMKNIGASGSRSKKPVLATDKDGTFQLSKTFGNSGDVTVADAAEQRAGEETHWVVKAGPSSAEALRMDGLLVEAWEETGARRPTPNGDGFPAARSSTLGPRTSDATTTKLCGPEDRKGTGEASLENHCVQANTGGGASGSAGEGGRDHGLDLNSGARRDQGPHSPTQPVSPRAALELFRATPAFAYHSAAAAAAAAAAVLAAPAGFEHDAVAKGSGAATAVPTASNATTGGAPTCAAGASSVSTWLSSSRNGCSDGGSCTGGISDAEMEMTFGDLTVGEPAAVSYLPSNAVAITTAPERVHESPAAAAAGIRPIPPAPPRRSGSEPPCHREPSPAPPLSSSVGPSSLSSPSRDGRSSTFSRSAPPADPVLGWLMGQLPL